MHDLRIARCNVGSAGADKIGEILQYNRSITSTALYKTKSLSFDQPDDCEVISDGLANTTVLQQHDLYRDTEKYSDLLDIAIINLKEANYFVMVCCILEAVVEVTHNNAVSLSSVSKSLREWVHVEFPTKALEAFIDFLQQD